MTGLRSAFILLSVAALSAPVFLGSSTADHPTTLECMVPILLCPDIIVDGTRFNPYLQTRTFTEDSCAVQEGHTQPGTRRLLRFTFTTPNVGLGDLAIGTPINNPLFEYGECHGHYHFKEYADYRLWTPHDHARWEALRTSNPGVQAHEILEANPNLQPIRGDKRGFCAVDLIRYSVTPPKYLHCGNQGISPGWADEYWHALEGQWIDVTGVPAGQYVLEAEVNAEQAYAESNFDNNRAYRNVTV